jgi:hypothetical protein
MTSRSGRAIHANPNVNWCNESYHNALSSLAQHLTLHHQQEWVMQMSTVLLSLAFLGGDDTSMKIALADLAKETPIDVRKYTKLCYASFQHAADTNTLSGPPLEFGLECLREACDNLVLASMPFPDPGPSLGTEYSLTNLERDALANKLFYCGELPRTFRSIMERIQG